MKLHTHTNRNNIHALYILHFNYIWITVVYTNHRLIKVTLKASVYYTGLLKREDIAWLRKYIARVVATFLFSPLLWLINNKNRYFLYILQSHIWKIIILLYTTFDNKINSKLKVNFLNNFFISHIYTKILHSIKLFQRLIIK